MKKNIIQLLGICVIMLMIVSCKKENEETGIKSVFSYVTDGYVVTFTNFSRDASQYLWDFGDGTGATSTRKSPQHIFKAKGNYLVSLTATKDGVTSTFIDTVFIVGPNIKIDGDFTDWEHVEYSHVNDENRGGTLRSLKTFTNGTELFFMLEGTMDMTLARNTFYLDTDLNTQTGYPMWQYPAGSGADYKLEGSAVDGWGVLQKHSGIPADGWDGFAAFPDVASWTEAIRFSAFRTVGDKKVVEFAIKREFLGQLSNSINFSIIENNLGYTQIGAMPANSFPEAKLGNFKF